MDKAILEAIKKKKMGGAPDLTVVIASPDKSEEADSDSDEAPSSGGLKKHLSIEELLNGPKDASMNGDSAKDEILASLLKDVSNHDKDALMNDEPSSLMDRVKKAQMMRKA